jgi:hypothetical protein
MRRTFERRSSSRNPKGTRISEMRNAKRIYLPLSLLLQPLAIVPLSCRGLVKEAFKTPKVRLVDVALTSNPLDDPRKPWDFTLSLEVDNRNDYPLEVAYVAYSAIIGRDTVAQGENREKVRLGASGLTVVKVPFSILPESFLSACRDSLLGRKVTYEFNGSVGMRAPLIGVVQIPFSKMGGFDPVNILKRKGFGFN